MTIKHDTNALGKLVRWDADWYKSLSDDECIVCLSEKQLYIISQAMMPLTWFGTRWQGDITDLDFDLIKSELEYRIAERMTCEKLTALANTIQQMQSQLTYIYNDLYADTATATGFDINTTIINDVYDTSALSALGYVAENCGDTGKDAIYGGVRQLIAYIAQNNLDFLEQVEQSAGNVAEQISTVLAAFPPTNLLALDDIADWTQFIIEELMEEYNATITQELIQETICDLFCIAVQNNCSLDFNDVFNYFIDKLPITISQFVTTWSNLIQFTIIGSFSGNDYFYYMCLFQLAAAGFGQGYLGLATMERYALELRAGTNSPDNDWSIFCTSCPAFTHWELLWDFAWGLGDFEIVSGTQLSDRIEGLDGGDTEIYNVKLNLNDVMNIKRLATFTAANTHIGNGSDDFERYSVFAGVDHTGGEQVVLTASFIAVNGDDLQRCNDSDAADSNALSIRFLGSMTDVNASSKISLKRVRIIAQDNGNGKPVLARWKITQSPCADFS